MALMILTSQFLGIALYNDLSNTFFGSFFSKPYTHICSWVCPTRCPNALLLELRATCPKYFSLIARHMLVSDGDAHVEAALDAVTVLMYLSSLSRHWWRSQVSVPSRAITLSPPPAIWTLLINHFIHRHYFTENNILRIRFLIFGRYSLDLMKILGTAQFPNSPYLS